MYIAFKVKKLKVTNYLIVLTLLTSLMALGPVSAAKNPVAAVTSVTEAVPEVNEVYQERNVIYLADFRKNSKKNESQMWRVEQ